MDKLTRAQMRFLVLADQLDGVQHLPARLATGAPVLPQQFAMVNRMIDRGLLEATYVEPYHFAQITEAGRSRLKEMS